MELISCFLAVTLATSVLMSWRISAEISPGFANHPCLRQCEVSAKPMDCYFYFKVENYFSMSKACYDCPYNVTDCYRPECVPTNGLRKRITVINRQLPGPSVMVCVGDRIIVDVENAIESEAVSIHWHGLLQHLTPHMDGVPYVTQCPIVPFSTFRYNFLASENGTFLYHSHTGVQKADGVFGALIIHRPNDPVLAAYDFDLPEHVMVVNDWLSEPADDRFQSHYQSSGSNHPESILVNGRGHFVPYVDGASSNHFTPYEVFKVEPGKRYRFRMISAGILNCPIQFSIDEHRLEIIAVDGNLVKTEVVDSLVIYSGERFDFVLATKANVSNDGGNFWMKFNGLLDCNEMFTSAHEGAILRYIGSSEALPKGLVSYSSTKRKGKVLNMPNTLATADLLGIDSLTSTMPDSPALRETPDKTLYVVYDFYYVDNPLYNDAKYFPTGGVRVEYSKPLPLFNHIHFQFPSAPLLSQLEDVDPAQICDADSIQNDCKVDFCSCTYVIKVPLGDVVEIVFVDEGAVYNLSNHQMHLHGHNFRVVAMGKLGASIKAEDVKQLDKANGIKRRLENAVIKDTVTVPDGGYTIIRFHANNLGFWMLHCHTDFHMATGMSLVIQVGEQEDFGPLVPTDFPKCGNFVDECE